MAESKVRIETARLLLRPISLADAPALAQMYAHPDVSSYLRPLDAMETAVQVQGFIDEWAEQGFGIFSVLHGASGDFLGRSGLHYWPQFDEVEVGWVLQHEAWGNGYATEAGAASLTWGFAERGLAEITAIIARANTRSVAVAARLEMSVLRDDHIFGQPVTVFSRRRPHAHE